MKQIEIESTEIIDDELGHRLKRSKRVVEVPDEKVRHCDWCTLCDLPDWPSHPNYPDCVKTCDKLLDEQRII